MSDWILLLGVFVVTTLFMGRWGLPFLRSIRPEPASKAESDVVDLDMRMVWVVTFQGQVDSVWLGQDDAKRAMWSYLPSHATERLGVVIKTLPCGGLTIGIMELEFRRHLVKGPV